MQASSFTVEQLQGFARTYEEDGVVHVPRLLSVPWIERLTRAVLTARDELTHSRGAVNPVEGSAAVGARVNHDARTSRFATADYSSAAGRFTVRWLWRDDPDVRAFFTDSGVAPVVAAIIGTRQLQYWYDLTFIHDPNADGEGTPWHHDIASFPCKGTQIPSLWIAMSDIHQDMSPLSCVRGSHRNRTMFRPPVYVDKSSPLPDGYGELPDVNRLVANGEYELIGWNISAGDALVIHPYTLHGAPANRSSRQRIAFTTRWAGDDVVWNPDSLSMKLPGVDLERVPRGERPGGEYFPYSKL